MKAIRKYTLMLLGIGVLLASCDSDYLNTVPTDEISEQTALADVSSIYKALNGVHRKMVSQDRGVQPMGGEPGFMIARDAGADDMTWDSHGAYVSNLTWVANLDERSAYNVPVWRTYYQFILNVNKILEALTTVTISPSETTLAQQIRGEALCIRAWSYFQLVQYYAKAYQAGVTNSQPGVPLRLTSETNDHIARSTVEEVYVQILADLDEAISLLSGYTAELNHYTEKSAWGLKARVALARQDYKNAGDYAVRAITLAEAEGLAMMTYAQAAAAPTSPVFANISTATQDAMYAALTQDDQSVYFYSFYAYISWNFSSGAVRNGVKCISEDTYNMMSSTDIRRTWWDPTGAAGVPNTSFIQAPYQNRKFTARSVSDAVGSVAFMRLTEMYLIASEAYARAGDDATAKTYFSAFVAQRDPSYTDLGNSGADLAEEVMVHRRIELWGEGFRWFDLKRLSLDCERKGSNFDVSFCGFLTKTQSEDGWEYEIPRQETEVNNLIEKNY